MRNDALALLAVHEADIVRRERARWAEDRKTPWGESDRCTDCAHSQQLHRQPDHTTGPCAVRGCECQRWRRDGIAAQRTDLPF